MSNINNQLPFVTNGLLALKELSMKVKRTKYPNIPYLVESKYSDKKTNDLTKCVIDWIELNGYQAERINSMGRQVKINGSDKWIKGSHTNGTSDISATIKGRSVKIEIKCAATGDRYQSDDQKEYQRKIEAAGGIYIVVRDFQGFYEWYQNFINGEGR
jgi:transposase